MHATLVKACFVFIDEANSATQPVLLYSESESIPRYSKNTV